MFFVTCPQSSETHPVNFHSAESGLYATAKRSKHYCAHPLRDQTRLVSTSGIPHFSYAPEEPGQPWRGIEVDLVNAIADKMGFKAEFVRSFDVTWVCFSVYCRLLCLSTR